MPLYGVGLRPFRHRITCRQVARNFPADMLTRAYASAMRVIELPYHQKLMLPQRRVSAAAARVFVIRDRFQRALAPVWLCDRRADLVRLDSDQHSHRSLRQPVGAVPVGLSRDCSSANGIIFISSSSAGGRFGFAVVSGRRYRRSSVIEGRLQPWIESVRPPPAGGRRSLSGDPVVDGRRRFSC